MPTCHCEQRSPEKSFRLSHPTSAWAEISNYTKYRFDCKWIWMFRAFSRSTNFSFASCVVLLLLCRSPRRDFGGVGSLLFPSCFVRHLLFLFFPRSTHSRGVYIPRATTKDTWSGLEKISYVHTREWARDEEKSCWMGSVHRHTHKKVHTDMQKSHFYSCFGPLPPCSPLAACLLNALVSAECLSTASSEKMFTSFFVSW